MNKAETTGKHRVVRLSAGQQYLRSHLPMTVVSALILVAVVFVAWDRWRRGAIIFGSAALVAAAFRLCLPTVQVGLLAVRSRPFDVATLTALGSAIVFLAATINTLGVS
ncbi:MULTISPECIES: DUF3017 domain-containing protein [Nocardia]|uniref:DUF3017 domain-containing protein n=1 Tax=Nocardia rhizosphaerihabitans TaxID=1691570 RepID=A0ABQ2KNC5_9NOCA|nr:DUF3017 domain-containing protein [Nocardia rhizosphaerihabitans]GGN86525.1 hypothetical protein GCM10011610_41910 [Nocardia rhizosphaerihabitans]